MRAVLFDFDYTLADSSEAILDCFEVGLRHVGLPAVAPEQVRRSIGLALPEALRLLHGVSDAALAQRFREAFHARAELVMAERAFVFEPVAEVTAALRAAGLATAICSTKRRDQIERILARFGLRARFDAIVGGEDVARHKPAPDALLLALERLGVGPERALYVGDHPVDAEAAASAGVDFVAVLSGPSRAEDFAAHAGVRFLESLAELPAALGLSR